MIEFKPINVEDKLLFESYLIDGNERGCNYNFANLYMWGFHQAAIFNNHIVLLAQFNNFKVYLYPIGHGDNKSVLDAVIADAKERGILCRITGMRASDKQTLDELYPGMFQFMDDRNSHDYVYTIDDLADLKGRKYHGKRNHYHRFCDTFPNYTAEPICKENLIQARQMIERWYEVKLQENPDRDYHMEQTAIARAFDNYHELGMEGLALLDGGRVLAVTLGSRMAEDTFDVHFEKAYWAVDGAYTAINYEFARYIRNKLPQIKYLNREEDMGIEGLRKSKESYKPHHMVEKISAYLVEE